MQAVWQRGFYGGSRAPVVVAIGSRQVRAAEREIEIENKCRGMSLRNTYIYFIVWFATWPDLCSQFECMARYCLSLCHGHWPIKCSYTIRFHPPHLLPLLLVSSLTTSSPWLKTKTPARRWMQILSHSGWVGRQRQAVELNLSIFTS